MAGSCVKEMIICIIDAIKKIDIMQLVSFEQAA